MQQIDRRTLAANLAGRVDGRLKTILGRAFALAVAGDARALPFEQV